LGSLVACGLAHRIGTPATLLAAGVACALGVLLFMRRLPELRRSAQAVYVRPGLRPALDPDSSQL
jgi:hypothetical protein